MYNKQKAEALLEMYTEAREKNLPKNSHMLDI
jgi:hypothetical protein